MFPRRFVVGLAVLLVLPTSGWGWGYRAHYTVNSGAITLLPEPLRKFYHLNSPYVVRHSVDPDLWGEMKEKAPAYAWPSHAHYIDLDLLDNAPFDGIPTTYQEALKTFGAEQLRKAGTLPWEIARRKTELTNAFRERNWEDVVKLSSWLAHLLTDATMPLHTTKNYKGQFTGNVILEEHGPNRHVHFRLEWGLISTFPEYYDTILGRAGSVRRIDDVSAEVWTTLKDSFDLIPEVLSADKEAAALDAGFGETYYRAFDGRMRSLVQRQLARSQELVASVWLTAWEDAGRPEVPTKRVIIELPAYAPTGSAIGIHLALLTILILAMAVLVLAWRLVRTTGRARAK